MKIKDYTSQSIINNTFFSIGSKIIPLLIALICIPIIIKGLGEERYGALTIALVFIGYFNLFDFGIGRAITKLISERVGKDNESEIADVYSTGVKLTFVLGIIGGIIFFFVSKPITIHYLNPSEALLPEILRGLNYLSIGIPFAILINSYKGVLEALHEFKAITFSQIVLGVITYFGIIIALQFTNDLGLLIAYLSAVKVIHFSVYYLITKSKVPVSTDQIFFNKEYAKRMFGFGGWITVTTIVSPIMSMLDRLVIASKVGMKSVAYYATSHEITQRVGFLPTAIVSVLFPVFSKNNEFNEEQNSKLYNYSFSLMLCGSVLFGIFFIGTAYDLLRIWIDVNFAQESFKVLQIIATGTVFNFIARIPFTFIQGADRPDVTAKFHLLELPIYLGALFFLINEYGIIGAAIATSGRMVLDFLFLHGFAGYKFKMSLRISEIMLACLIPVGLTFFISSFELAPLMNLLAILLLMLVVFLSYWFIIFDEKLKVKLSTIFKKKSHG